MAQFKASILVLWADVLARRQGPDKARAGSGALAPAAADFESHAPIEGQCAAFNWAEPWTLPESWTRSIFPVPAGRPAPFPGRCDGLQSDASPPLSPRKNQRS